MRTSIGLILILLIITGATLIVLAVWGIQPISWTVVWKSGVTIAIVGAVLLLVSVVKLLFLGTPFWEKSKQKNLG